MDKNKRTIKEIFYDWVSFCEKSNHFDPYADAMEHTINEVLNLKKNWDRDRAKKLINYLIYER